jgi:hypothetical protein
MLMHRATARLIRISGGKGKKHFDVAPRITDVAEPESGAWSTWRLALHTAVISTVRRRARTDAVGNGLCRTTDSAVD